jgi:8-oxo-dGTP diphosphatase
MSVRYRHARPALTVDCVVFGLDQRDLKVLLIERALEPFAGQWALPGGFVRIDETVEQAARRELQEETGLDKVYLEQLYTFGDLDRDPRERVVSVAYYALVRLAANTAQANTDARKAEWFALNRMPSLAFDHDRIFRVAYERLQNKVCYQPIGFELLPKKFTLSQLQQLYEIILGQELDKRNFRKKMLGMNVLVETDEYEQGVAHRAARLYRFHKTKYQELLKRGFHFEV